MAATDPIDMTVHGDGLDAILERLQSLGDATAQLDETVPSFDDLASSIIGVDPAPVADELPEALPDPVELEPVLDEEPVFDQPVLDEPVLEATVGDEPVIDGPINEPLTEGLVFPFEEPFEGEPIADTAVDTPAASADDFGVEPDEVLDDRRFAVIVGDGESTDTAPPDLQVLEGDFDEPFVATEYVSAAPSSTPMTHNVAPSPNPVDDVWDLSAISLPSSTPAIDEDPVDEMGLVSLTRADRRELEELRPSDDEANVAVEAVRPRMAIGALVLILAIAVLGWLVINRNESTPNVPQPQPAAVDDTPEAAEVGGVTERVTSPANTESEVADQLASLERLDALHLRADALQRASSAVSGRMQTIEGLIAAESATANPERLTQLDAELAQEADALAELEAEADRIAAEIDGRPAPTASELEDLRAQLAG